MAIVKISALPAAAAVAATDLVPIVDDPAGTPATQKATWSLARDYVLGVSGGTATIAETVTAPTFIGALQGNADTATSATTATTATSATSIGITDAGADTQTYVLLANTQTGTQGARTNGSLTYNAATGTLSTTFVSASSGLIGTVNTAAQPNITSVGTLTSLAIAGHLTLTSNNQSWFTIRDLADVGNYGTFLKADGTTLAYIGAGGGAATGAGTASDFCVRAVAGRTVLASDAGASLVIGSVSEFTGNVSLTGAGTKYVGFTRDDGTANVGGLGWDGGYFYVAGHPSLGPTAGSITRLWGFGAETQIGNSTLGAVVTIAGTTDASVGIGLPPVGFGRVLAVGSTTRATTYVRVVSQTAGVAWFEALASGGISALFGVNNSGATVQAIPSGSTGIVYEGNFVCASTAGVEHLRLSSAGDLTITGDITTTGGGNRIITQASTGGSPGGAGFRLTPGSLPLTFSNGDMWCDNSGVYIRIGGVTKTFTLT